MTAAGRVLALLPQLRADEESDALLAILITSWMSDLERAADVAYGTDATPYPWEALTDPSTAPLWALPHAAQWTGGTMPRRQPGEDDTAYLLRARAEVVRPRGMLRGAYSALVTAMQARLIGTRYVSIVEWVDDSPWKLAARVIVAEAPDVDALYLAANAPDAVPAGMHVEIVASSGDIWDEADIAWDAATGSWDEN
jgi:hypothetical protein